jgi:1-aminocyclopropane-1-carboxylate deaminase/D-cysteine desulfhydrase-like pyridoxal-dependent ACC family enzyme
MPATSPVRPRPRLEQHLPDPPRCLQLAVLPTPVERAPWLDTAHAEAWIKRDDRSSPLYGGGKVRKLEWALANPPYDGPEGVTSIGGTGSNHLVALAIFLHSLDRRLHAIVFDQPIDEHVLHNLGTVASLGSTFSYYPKRWMLPIAYLARWLRPRPERGRSMEPGASTPLACFGFVEAGLELAAQIAAGEVPQPRTIFITGGTGGASAGLALGLSIAGVSTHLHVVSAVEPVLYNTPLMRAKLRAVHTALRRCGLAGPSGVGTRLGDAGVTWALDHRFVGEGYGARTAAGTEAAARAAEHGVHLDGTYTSKCAAALHAADTRGPVLFWHTHAATDLRPLVQPGWEARLPPRLRTKIERAQPAIP